MCLCGVGKYYVGRGYEDKKVGGWVIGWRDR